MSDIAPTIPASDPRNPAWTAAQTAWGEARGDGRDGMTAVLNVIANRVANPGWWGTDILSVCLKPYQFSCWIPDSNPDSDYSAMQAVTTDTEGFTDALQLAELLVAGQLPDITGGADSYYAMSIAPPNWVATAKLTKQIGEQLFFITRS